MIKGTKKIVWRKVEGRKEREKKRTNLGLERWHWGCSYWGEKAWQSKTLCNPKLRWCRSPSLHLPALFLKTYIIHRHIFLKPFEIFFLLLIFLSIDCVLTFLSIDCVNRWLLLNDETKHMLVSYFKKRSNVKMNWSLLLCVCTIFICNTLNLYRDNLIWNEKLIKQLL